MTAYQKLKAENLKLKQQLITVATNPDSIDAKIILFGYKINADIEKALWHGGYMPTLMSKGLYSQIQEK